MKILEVNNLKTSFFTDAGEIEAVRGISFCVKKGEVVGIVGESGSGKSVTSMSVMGLIKNPGKIKDGEVIFQGENILTKSEKELRNIRGKKITMIFQDPMTSLNPVYTVGTQIIDVLRNHMGLNKKDARIRAIEMLELVGISSPEKRIDSYPHELSGGMRQRVMIAMALSCEPDILIADEPTTALDVTIQAQILELMKNLKDRIDTSVIIITHDLGVVAEICDRVIVMYGGLIIEEGSIDEIFYNSKHPYTKGLLECIPGLENKKRLIPIKGYPPKLLNPSKGCPFYRRCSSAMNICDESFPPFVDVSDSHKYMCWLNRKEIK